MPLKPSRSARRRAIVAVAVYGSIAGAQTTRPLGGSLVIDGRPVAIAEVDAVGPPPAVAEAVAGRWQRERPDEPVVRRETAGWLVLEQRLGTGLRTLQLRTTARGGSHGYEAHTARTARATAPPPFGLPPGLRILRTVASSDAGREAVQIVAIAKLSPMAVERGLAALAASAGWTPETPSGRASPGSASAAQALVFRRGDEQVLAIVGRGPAPSTLVLLHTKPRSGR